MLNLFCLFHETDEDIFLVSWLLRFQKCSYIFSAPKLLLEYIQFSIGGMAAEGGIEAVRNVCERAITAAGLNVAEGSILWEAYREFENAIMIGLQVVKIRINHLTFVSLNITCRIRKLIIKCTLIYILRFMFSAGSRVNDNS